jgi:hypothetical protein
MARTRRILQTAVLVTSLLVPAGAQTELLRLDGAAAGDQFGSALAFLGDIDGDGAADLAVGAPRENGRAGAVHVFSGRTGAALYTVSGAGPDDFFGHDIEVLGDVDGDLISDWIAGAPEREILIADCSGPAGGFGTLFGVGYVVAVSGASGVPLYTVPAPVGTDSFGFSLGAGGDAQADGVPDFLAAGGLSQKAWVFDGATGLQIREHDVSVFNGTTYSLDFIGAVDAMIGDEYALGWIDLTGCGSGSVRAYRGMSGKRYWTDHWCVLGAEYGFNVKGVGDLDGDGTPDVMTSGLDTIGFGCSGQSFARTLSGYDGSLFQHTIGWTFGGRGRAIEPMGDLDGDGRAEYAVGEPGIVGPGGGQETRVLGGSNAQVWAVLAPDDPSDRFGGALAAGDSNGDGLAELAIGARLDDDVASDAGSVRVYTILAGPTTYCDAEVNSQGCTPTIFFTGMPKVNYNNFRIKAANVLNNKLGLLFWGTAPQSTPFGGGSKCVASPTVRTAVQNSEGNPPPDDCSGSFSFHFNKPLFNAYGLQAGEEIYAQYWSRDPSAQGSTTNLSDALAFTVLP